jgi:hypothetical protein
MPWFKVDDKLHSHRKVIRAGIDAMGLWVVAGSWCADQLGDGFVPDCVAQRLDPDYAKHAAALVAAKLWIPGEKDGETGWYFHQWSEDGRQPTSESVNAKRDEARERMAKLRAQRAEEAKTKKDGSQDVRANTSRTSSEVRSTPTRPDPTPVVPTEQQQGEEPRARASEASTGNGTPVWAVPLIDQLTAEGFVVTWDLGFVDWDIIRKAIDHSGIPAMIQHVHRRHQASKTAAYSARAWLKGWSKLPTLDAGSTLPAPPERQADVIQMPAQRPSTTDARVAQAKASGAEFAALWRAQQASAQGAN